MTSLQVSGNTASKATGMEVLDRAYMRPSPDVATAVDEVGPESIDPVDRRWFPFDSETASTDLAKISVSDADTRLVNLDSLEFRPLVALLRARELGDVAERMDDLHDIVLEDPEVDSIDIVSFRQMVGFMLCRPGLPEPGIGITLEGFVHLEWKLPERGRVVMKFIGAGKVRVVVMSRLIGVKASFPVKGEYSLKNVFDVVSPWLERTQ